MKLFRAHTLAEIAEILGCTFKGNPEHLVTGINEIHRVEAGDIVFVDHPKYYDKALNSAATTILIDKEVDCPVGKGLLISKAPFTDFNKLTTHFKPVQVFSKTIALTANIGDNCTIAPTVSIGENVQIGNNCTLQPGVVLYDNTVLGNNVTIHANAVLGADAFYFQKREGAYVKMHSCGHVVIEDNVEIGANCTIDRGVSAITKIGKGSKLDNHIHIGHDTTLGENCLMAAQSAVAGCVSIGNNVIIWGQCAIASDVRINDGVELLAKSGVNKDLEAGKRYFGAPALEAREKMKEMAAIKRIINS